MASSADNDIWYIDSGASFHVIGNKEYFSHWKEDDTQLQIELGDDGNYATRGVGTISFERESGSSLYLRDVLYVPCLKNLVTIATLKDKG